MCAKYSFIMPAYKARFLKEAIDSILKQTFIDLELIIVNDASPEPIEEIVKSYNDCRIQYYKNEVNIGGMDLIAQWNKCLSYAKGEFVILATDDDVYDIDYLLKMDQLVCKYHDCDAFRPQVMVVNDKLNIKEVDGFMPEFCDKSVFLYYFLKRHINTGIGFWIFRRSRLLKNGGYSEMPLAWCSDDLTALVMAENGVCFYPQPLYKFRHSGESISTKRNGPVELKEKLCAMQLFRKHIQKEISRLIENKNDKFIYPFDRAFKSLYFGNVQELVFNTTKKGLLQSWKEIVSVEGMSKRGMMIRVLYCLLRWW